MFVYVHRSLISEYGFLSREISPVAKSVSWKNSSHKVPHNLLCAPYMWFIVTLVLRDPETPLS